MKEEEFNHSMKKVRACFPAGLPDPKILILYEKLKWLTGPEFDRVCEKLITTKNHAPSVADFIAEAQAYVRKPKPFEIRRDSMFTENQIKCLFEIVRRSMAGQISRQDTALISKELEYIIKDNSKERANALFVELNETYDLNYLEA